MPIVTGVISCPLLEDKNFLKSYIYNQTSQKTLKKENKDNEKREKICEYPGKIQIVISALNSTPEANGNKDRKFSLGAQKMIDHNDKK